MNLNPLNQLTKATMPEKPTNGNINKIQSYQNAMKRYICETYKNLQQVAKSADLDPQSKTEDGSDINIAKICAGSNNNSANPTGPTGSIGSTGPTGFTGLTGSNGSNGSTGLTSLTCLVGSLFNNIN